MRSDETPAGYRHVRTNDDGGRLFAPISDEQPRRFPRRPVAAKPAIDWPAIHAKARAEIIPGELYDFADVVLGLSGESMDLLDVGVINDEYVFPERDECGRIIGILRRTKAGKKIAMSGGKRGLAYQYPLPVDDPVLVVEGPTDVAAAIEAGYTAVGRPSNVLGGEMLAKLLRGRRVIVFGENDQKDDGRWPGREGVECIIEHLNPVCASVQVLYPPDGVKDLRVWLGGAA